MGTVGKRAVCAEQVVEALLATQLCSRLNACREKGQHAADQDGDNWHDNLLKNVHTRSFALPPSPVSRPRRTTTHRDEAGLRNTRHLNMRPHQSPVSCPYSGAEPTALSSLPAAEAVGSR